MGLKVYALQDHGSIGRARLHNSLVDDGLPKSDVGTRMKDPIQYISKNEQVSRQGEQTGEAEDKPDNKAKEGE